MKNVNVMKRLKQRQSKWNRIHGGRYLNEKSRGHLNCSNYSNIKLSSIPYALFISIFLLNEIVFEYFPSANFNIFFQFSNFHLYKVPLNVSMCILHNIKIFPLPSFFVCDEKSFNCETTKWILLSICFNFSFFKFKLIWISIIVGAGKNSTNFNARLMSQIILSSQCMNVPPWFSKCRI